MVARIIPVPSFDLVVFGGTGDLSRRKLIPALYRRMRDGQAPTDARIFAAARSDLDDDGFRALALEALEAHVPADERPAEDIAQFLSMLHYVHVDATEDDGWTALAARLGPKGDRVRAFYLSVAPSLFGPIAARLASAGLAGDRCRIVVEKPLGRDLASAQALNAQLAAHFNESQLYRIDHYLGKETVQNLMAIRFANALFEPVWNARHIDHVQITVAESLGVEGRGGYYDRSGAMRDMVQNHLMQLLCLTAMEPPNLFNPDAVRDEKLKVIRALDPIGAERIKLDSVRGQYRGGPMGASYAVDAGDDASSTESFVALKVGISNWRWAGTPFYLRTGKRLRARTSEIAIQFKAPPHSIFEGQPAHGNALVIRLQPDEGITLNMTIKEPGPGGMRLIETPLDMTFAKALQARGIVSPDAYERLIMDVIRGDQTLFMRGDEVEAAWTWVDPIIAAWEGSGDGPRPYDSGGSGPEDALMLLHRDGRRWREMGA
ncbi:MAG: glucose-6-phosphate 1-dehydrogenase [Paracoccaceae bacterium]|jgi:glucose-6-phosphate 1-dehydrogenase